MGDRATLYPCHLVLFLWVFECELVIRQQLQYFTLINCRDQRTAPQLSFPLGRLLGQNVSLVGVATLEAARAGFREALRGSTVGSQFRHDAFRSL
jgi:hypothetical protein